MRWRGDTHKSPVSIMCSRRRSTRTSRLPAGVMPRARHWMRRSFTMRCFRVSLMEEPSILHNRQNLHHGAEAMLREVKGCQCMHWLQPGELHSLSQRDLV